MIRFTKAAAAPPKPKKPTGEKKAALDRLGSFLAQAEPEALEILVSNFNAQQNAVTYKELREAYLAGGITQKQFEKWQRDYAKLITGALAPKWEEAAAAAAQEVKDKYPYFVYEPSAGAGMDFIKQHGAELVANLAQEQRQALNAVIQHVSGYTNITPDEAARIIRPCIGLTRPQALANARYREKLKNSIYEAHRKAHPHGSAEKAAQIAERKAQEAAARYAARQHRYRAQNIARTELAFAYNAGAYGATRDAQAQGYIGACVKVWLTAYDERVCPICSAMDDEKRNMDEPFSNGTLLPPAHPSCRCAVAFEEIPGTNLNPGTDSLENAVQEETPLPPPDTAPVSNPETTATVVDTEDKPKDTGAYEENPGTNLHPVGSSDDRKEYEAYREVLGENAPKTLAEFLDMKYNDGDRWDYTKRLAEYMRKYPNSDKKYFDIWETLKSQGIKKGVVLPPVQKQAFILPSGKHDPYHIMHRMRERNITDDEIRSYMQNAKVMFVQWSGQRQRFVSDAGMCVVTKDGDDWIFKTVWNKSDYDEEADKIMEAIKNAGL